MFARHGLRCEQPRAASANHPPSMHRNPPIGQGKSPVALVIGGASGWCRLLACEIVEISAPLTRDSRRRARPGQRACKRDVAAVPTSRDCAS